MELIIKYRKWFQVLILIIIILSLKINVIAQSLVIPELITPVYQKIKNLYSEISLVIDGKPVSAIVSSKQYSNAAKVLQAVIEKRTRVKVPIIADTSAGAATPFIQNLIVLGNRSTSKTSNELYDRYYSLMDLKYPGRHGYSVRSLHNPYGNGFSAILVGGSDSIGVAAGAQAFASALDTLPASSGNLNARWTMLTRLGDGIKVPTDIRDFETWEASKHYGSVGYFGWNTISKRMAMYYMTGNTFNACEVLRLSFPDAQALKEIDEIDGERIENKKDPLAGPYHYNAMMLILYWDLIEESPVFSDVERLKVTNAFARRFTHDGTGPFDRDIYKLNTIPESVGSRHRQWSALSVYTLARYFNKYYPSSMWVQAERAGQLHFKSLHKSAWVQGEKDYLPWYPTGIAPILVYMILAGDHKPLENGVLQQLLRGQEILLSGKTPDRMLNCAALGYLNKAAYLTGDGRWITYRKRTGMNTDIFRLGQSFWPDKNIKPAIPINMVGKWMINPMPESMWKMRHNKFKLKESFLELSYRSAPDSLGDFILLTGYNGAYRNPYHTFDILELRLNGATLLDGYNNQVLTSADGMVEAEAAMDAALLYNGVVGQMAVAIGEVPDLPFVNWQRSVAFRKGRYVLIADDLGFRVNSDNILAETTWEMPGATWIPKYNMIKIRPKEIPKVTFELHSSEPMEVKSGEVTTMKWRGAVQKGQRRVFFHLLGQNPSGSDKTLACLKLSDNAAALALPEAGIVVKGQYKNLQGDLVLLSEKTLYGHAVHKAGLTKLLMAANTPIETDWDFATGKLAIINNEPVTLTLALASSRVIVNGKVITGKALNGLYTFDLAAGNHEITGAFPSTGLTKILNTQLPSMLLQAGQSRIQQKNKNAVAGKKAVASFIPVMQAELGGKPVESILIPSSQGDLLGMASGNTVTLLSPEGQVARTMTTPGEIRVLRWWPEPNLLLVGCADEKVIAFDEQGNKKWEFTSVMDPAVYEAGKPYWFKSRYPGIYGLYSGYFDKGKSRAFVGSACTLEILDENGQLVKRIPVFWGNIRQFLMVNASDGSKNLLVGQWRNGFNDLSVINNDQLKVVKKGYTQVPPGHTIVNGWGAMNRFDNFLVDLYGDGMREVVSAINGTWNRVSIYSEDGKPLYNAQFGPGAGSTTPRSTMRMMDVGDLMGDSKPEIIVGTSSGMVVVLDGHARKLWAKSLSSPPTVVKLIKKSTGNWLCVGSEDGTVVAMDTGVNIIRQGKVKGRPINIQVIQTQKGEMVVLTTDTGEVSGFRLN